MTKKFTGDDARSLRRRNGWSLQYLANVSGINKAYLSEFENGLRTLAVPDAERLHGLLERQQVAGRAAPKLLYERDHYRLVFVDSTGRIYYRPRIAHIEWTEDDGSSYRMFVGAQ